MGQSLSSRSAGSNVIIFLGMNQQQALNDIRQIIRRNLPDKNYRIFLFGSRAGGFARRFSDFDIGIAGKTRVPARQFNQIQSDLEDSDFPYKVEIVDFKDIQESFKNLALKHTLPL